MTDLARTPVFLKPCKKQQGFLEPQQNMLLTVLTGTAMLLVGHQGVEGKVKPERGDTLQGGITALNFPVEEEEVQAPLTQGIIVEGKKYRVGIEAQEQNLQGTTLATAGLSTLRPQWDWSGVRKVRRDDTLFYNNPGLGVIAKPVVNFDWSGKCKSSKGTIFYPGRISGEGVEPPAEPTPLRMATQDTFAVAKQKPRREDLQPINLLTSTLYVRGLMPDLWPEPARRKQSGFIGQDTNRLPLYLGAAPTLQPKFRSEWPQVKLPRLAFSTEYHNLLPLQIGPEAIPFGSGRFTEGRVRPKFDVALQAPQPLTALFQQGETPTRNYDWDGRSSIRRAGLESQPTNLLLLGGDFGRPLQRNIPEETGKPSGQQVELLALGSARILLDTAPQPFVYTPWPEGHGRVDLRWQAVVPAPYNLTILLPIGATPPEPPEPPTGPAPRTEAMEEYEPANQLLDPAAQREVQRISQVLKQFSTKGVRVAHVAPEKPVDAQAQVADGNNWDPMGDGVKSPVWYDSATGTWKRFVPGNYLTAGTYTPVSFLVDNVSEVTTFSAQYMRIGAVVQVAGRIQANAMATGATRVGLSLPIGSNFTAAGHLAGTGTGVDGGEAVAIRGDTINHRAELVWQAVELANQFVYYNFSYRITA